MADDYTINFRTFLTQKIGAIRLSHSGGFSVEEIDDMLNAAHRKYPDLIKSRKVTDKLNEIDLNPAMQDLIRANGRDDAIRMAIRDPLLILGALEKKATEEKAEAKAAAATAKVSQDAPEKKSLLIGAFTSAKLPRTGEKFRLDFAELTETLQAIYDSTGHEPWKIGNGVVEHGPLAGKVTFNILQARLTSFHARNPGCGFNSISSFMRKNRIGPFADAAAPAYKIG